MSDTDIVNIRPVDASENNFLAVGPIPRIFPPPDVPVRVLGFRERWLLKKNEDNTAQVFAGRGNPQDYKWIVRGKVLYISSVIQEADNFRFESAGDDQVVIGIPNEDLLLTYESDVYPPLTFQPANGSSAQRFQVTSIPRTKA